MACEPRQKKPVVSGGSSPSALSIVGISSHLGAGNVQIGVQSVTVLYCMF